MTYARGRLPENKLKPKLKLADFLAVLPDHPLVDEIPAMDFPMDHNDSVGCCVVAGADHALRVIDTLLLGSYTQPSDATLLRWYQSQNPDFRDWSEGGGNADRGMIVADFLAWLVKQGVILGFAKVDHANPDQMRAAVYLGLAVVTGEDVREAQMNSQVWDYTPRSPDDGGHCTVCHNYKPGRLGVITWGSGDYAMTDAYLEHGVDEAYMLITQAHVDHPDFRDHFDLPAFAAAFEQITGRDFPVPVPPSPTPPAPSPSPAPVDGNVFRFDPADVALLEAWSSHPHWYSGASTKDAKAAWGRREPFTVAGESWAAASNRRWLEGPS